MSWRRAYDEAGKSAFKAGGCCVAASSWVVAR